MRPWLFVATALLGSGACAPRAAPLTEAQRQGIADTAVALVRGAFLEGTNRLDVARAFRDYSFDPDVQVVVNGQVFPAVEDFRQAEAAAWRTFDSLEATPRQLRPVVLGPDAALVVAPYTFAAVPRGGRPIRGNAVATFVLQRRGGRWQVVHQHESVVDVARITRELEAQRPR